MQIEFREKIRLIELEQILAEIKEVKSAGCGILSK